MKVVKLSPRYYSLLRSFVESSRKEKYPHNKPYLLLEREGGKVIQFRKRGKWLLSVEDFCIDLRGKRGQKVKISLLGEKVIIGEREFTPPAQFTADAPGAVPISILDVLEKAEFYAKLAQEIEVEVIDLSQPKKAAEGEKQ